MKKFKHTFVLAGALFSASFTPALHASAAETVSNASSTYKVLSGDTLSSIAAKFGVSLNTLLASNPSIQSPNLIYAGQVIRVPAQQQSSLSTQTNNTDTYKVVAGDNMSSIAEKLGVTLQSLLAANPSVSDPARIYIGQTLQVPGQAVQTHPSNQAPSQPSTLTASTVTKAGAYRVVAGDTMSSIAAKMGVSLSALLNANLNIKAPYLIYTGQSIQIPSSSAQSSQSTQAPVQFNADVTSNSTAAATAAGLDKNKLIATAEQYMGTPYEWGGSSTSGFDCSGFTQYVFAKYGVNQPRTSEEQYASGTPVSSPAPGDLVFFDTDDSGPDHVGIYIGGGQFISSTISYGVHIDSLSNPYWGPRYLGARRV